jgi:ribonuclease BN (tRNA processing enzyme)
VESSPDIVCVHIHKSYAHPKSGVYIYRVEWKGKSVVFASDTEGYVDTDRRLVAFSRDTDLIIHDAQYTEEEYAMKKQGWGHSTPAMACDVARLANARRLVLFHHEPLYDDEKIAAIERTARENFPDTIAAYEGLEIVL